MSPLTQAEFDQLATFVAVAEELSMEPFVSEDNHEKLAQFGESSGCPVIVAHFCHPAFLKSALMPFRKLWLPSETCAFEKVRKLVFEKHPDQNELSGHHESFYGMYSYQLAQPADPQWAKESCRDILDIWINTQAVHTGKKQAGTGKSMGRFTLQDFDQWTDRIGRERFEYLFRTSLRVIADVYIQFLTKLARPLFGLLQRDYNMVPGFEAAATLKYSPYPNPRYRITFDDVFWHLDKETMEETFDRLLERHTFQILNAFLFAYFKSRANALAAVCEDTSFAAMLERTGAVRLKPGQVVEEQLMCRHSAIWGTAFGPVKFEVYEGRKVRFLDGTEGKFAEAYGAFRKCLFEERKRQRRQRLAAW
jgi:hypothetical protein